MLVPVRPTTSRRYLDEEGARFDLVLGHDPVDV